MLMHIYFGGEIPKMQHSVYMEDPVWKYNHEVLKVCTLFASRIVFKEMTCVISY